MPITTHKQVNQQLNMNTIPDSVLLMFMRCFIHGLFESFAAIIKGRLHFDLQLRPHSRIGSGAQALSLFQGKDTPVIG